MLRKKLCRHLTQLERGNHNLSLGAAELNKAPIEKTWQTEMEAPLFRTKKQAGRRMTDDKKING